jgi:hypothetical protein
MMIEIAKKDQIIRGLEERIDDLEVDIASQELTLIHKGNSV